MNEPSTRHLSGPVFSTSTSPGQKLKTRIFAPVLRTWSRSARHNPAIRIRRAVRRHVGVTVLARLRRNVHDVAEIILRMCGRTARTNCITPRRFVSITVSHPSSVISSTVSGTARPELLISTSIACQRSKTSATKFVDLPDREYQTHTEKPVRPPSVAFISLAAASRTSRDARR